MFDERATYRAALIQAFANECPNYRQEQIDAMMRSFDKIATKSPQLAFKIVHESYGNSDTTKLLGRIGSIIKDGLEKANQSGQTIETNPLKRLREAMDKVKAREGKGLELEVSPRLRVGVLQTEETMRDNGVLERKRVFRSVASEKVKAGLELEIRL